MQVLFKYMPYFYISVEKGMEREVESVLRRKYADQVADVVIKSMWDLDMPNHLAGNQRTELQLKFRNVQVWRARLPGRLLAPACACVQLRASVPGHPLTFPLTFNLQHGAVGNNGTGSHGGAKGDDGGR